MIVLAFLLGVHRVVTTRVEGVAAGDAAEAFPESDGEREATQTFEGVSGAGGVEATTSGGLLRRRHLRWPQLERLSLS